MGWSFDETNDDVQITDNVALTFPDGDWTLSGWVKLDDNIGSFYQYFFSWGAFEGVPSINWFFIEASELPGPSGGLRFHLVDDDATSSGNITSTSTPGTRTDWIHLILQRSGNTITQYIDNVADGDYTDAAFDGINVAENLFFGSRSDSDADRRLGGSMAEWAKWDRALNSSERAALVAGVSPWRFQDSLKWYVPMRIGGANGLYADYGSSRLTITNNGSTNANHAPVSIAHLPLRSPVSYFIPPVVGGRIMSSLANHGGLAGFGGIAGRGGGLAG